MSQIRITPSDLRTSSKNITTHKETIETTLSALATEISNVTSNWEGASQSGFIQSYEEMQEVLKNFPPILQGIASQLSTAAETLEDADQKIAEAFRAQ